MKQYLVKPPICDFTNNNLSTIFKLITGWDWQLAKTLLFSCHDYETKS